jgi:hypothetical protein
MTKLIGLYDDSIADNCYKLQLACAELDSKTSLSSGGHH